MFEGVDFLAELAPFSVAFFGGALVTLIFVWWWHVLKCYPRYKADFIAKKRPSAAWLKSEPFDTGERKALVYLRQLVTVQCDPDPTEEETNNGWDEHDVCTNL